VEELAERFDTTPGRLRPTLRKLEQGGLIAIEGEVFPTIYPTVQMLRDQNPKLKVAEAEKINRRLRRS
jgi:hypothetical protein